MKRHNIHTHTNLSDGVLYPRSLIREAKTWGTEILGISDHAFSKKLSETHQINNICGYLDNLKNISNEMSNIKVLVGLEIDVSKNYGINPTQLPFDELNKLDYVLFEYVNTEKEYWGTVGMRDISEIINIRDKLVIPIGLAHNDLQLNYDGKENEIASTLVDNDIFVELCQSEFSSRRNSGRNTRNGLDYYKHFSKEMISALSYKKVKVLAGTDAHSGIKIYELDDVNTFIEENNLKVHKIAS